MSKQSNSNRLTRREFIKGAVTGAAGVALLGTKAFADAALQANKEKLNLLFIHTDQQHFEALSGLGNRFLRTPNMDRLLARGVSFSQSYSADPVCCPARACWYTGRAASENAMLSNDHRLLQSMPDLGQWFGARGYAPFYTGKWHIPGRDPASGFNVITDTPSGIGELTDPIVSRSAQAFLSSYSGDKPFFLSVSLLQPHDCCYWVFARHEDLTKLPYPSLERKLPRLPKNHNYDVEEPPTLKRMLDGLRKWTSLWSDLQWRYYIWSYYRHVEMVDAELGRIIDALDDSEFSSNTAIVFTSDHGDGLGRRKLVQKWFAYDESSRVPLIICPPGARDGGRRDTSHLVSGLDMAPTLCDYAGIEAPPHQRGRSIRPLVEGKAGDWREFVVSEMHITGRMVRTPEYKFVAYKGEDVYQLFDMRSDPWEMSNLAAEAKYASLVTDLKKRLDDWESRLIVAG